MITLTQYDVTIVMLTCSYIFQQARFENLKINKNLNKFQEQVKILAMKLSCIQG